MTIQKLTVKFFAVALASATVTLASAQTAPAPQTFKGTLPDGATWSATIPINWNKILLLYSRGYATQQASEVQEAPGNVRLALLEQGYGVVASDYAKTGWSVEEAIADQVDTLAEVRKRIGKPAKVIAWGFSMGGLVTTALAEQHADKLDGALSMCSSMAGAVGMMNMALDGAFAFKTLLAPQSDIALVRTRDDRANGARVAAVLAEAQMSAAGRARVALAGVLAGIPGWTSASARPSATDFATQQQEIAKTFVMGVFLPRADQELRAGGIFSWNDGTDYRKQLASSGRLPMVEALYTSAGLSLDDDLSKLDHAPRIKADPAAVDYMKRFYTPTGKPGIPMLAVQKIGDGMTSPSLQDNYAQAADRQVPAKQFSSRWIAQPGHCDFSAADMLASVDLIRERLGTGAWPPIAAPFVQHTPAPMLRACIVGGTCN